MSQENASNKPLIRWVNRQQMQDGTKIRAAASPRSVQRESTIQEHWERARRRVKEMGDPRDEEK